MRRCGGIQVWCLTDAVTCKDATEVFPVLSWLIDHPGGLVLFDTGMRIDLQTGNDRIGEERSLQLAARRGQSVWRSCSDPNASMLYWVESSAILPSAL